MRANIEANRIVHGMWVGNALSRLELLTLSSFLHFGHDFHLWAYDEIATPLPKGVRLRDASEIIPRQRVFRKTDYDPETGVGKGSYGAPFSDLFRYRLLHEHGGIWVDMDVTCLRPFDFSEDYIFRSHRIGAVGSIIKCPRGSPLMRDTYEEVSAVADQDAAWLTPNRILNKHIDRLGLASFIRPDISNLDSWMHVLRPFIEHATPIPDAWYAIHWVNEFWRTIKEDKGYYRGRKIVEDVPDKDNPIAGSTLYELYRRYDLIDPWEGVDADLAEGALAKPIRGQSAPGERPMRPSRETGGGPSHVNILIPALVRGGAERSVLETVESLRAGGSATQTLHVMSHARQHYPIESGKGLEVVVPQPGHERRSLRQVALDVARSPVPVLYTHLIRVAHLGALWRLGVTTVPVVQNDRRGWLDSPVLYNHPSVPFVIAVADAVAAQVRDSGCTKAVLTLRHESQRWFKPADLAKSRRRIRDQYGIGDDTLLIGMIGQFKSQKAYTRAVRVLAAMQRICRTKLMILGGWNHDYGTGRAAYEATARLAVELDVIADLMTPGDIHPVDPYLAAFDVFMNTSVYEGLSVALREAIQAGCPIVAANVGGNREVLASNAVLVEDASDIAAYVAGICQFLNRGERVVPVQPLLPDLVPRLWAMLAKHGVIPSLARPGPPSGTLFVCENLHVGGPQRSLVNLLSHFPASARAFLCILGGTPVGISGNSSLGAWRGSLDRAEVPVLSTEGMPNLLDRAERILQWADQLNVQNICFWNVGPEIKLTIAKVLSVRPVRLVDVSPGPMLLDELEAAAAFQQRVCLTTDQYLGRLDAFVAKHAGGLPSPARFGPALRTVVIPNGVPTPPRFVPLPPAGVALPRDVDPAFAIGTCCRIVPDKNIEFLFDMMRHLTRNLPSASLTIVGGPDPRHTAYSDSLMARIGEERISNIRFVGSHSDINSFLSQFQVFVMASDREGCPNASLEAMAMKLPVVATPSGGTAEQIDEGVSGFFVADPAGMALRVEALLRNPAMRRRFGARGREIARERFSMDDMVARYLELLDGTPVARTSSIV
jgi:glycosyltransferase involved in cell wall biosynthesis